MKALATLVLTAIFEASLFAQQPADPTPLEPATPAPTAPAPEAAGTQPTATATDNAATPAPAPAAEPELVKKWREEVLAWKDPQRVEKGTKSLSIDTVNRSVLILGDVDGNVSTVSGNIAVLGTVNGNVTAVSGSITVLGTINGEASSVSGDLRVGGKVTGSTSAIGGKIETAPGSQLLGSSNSTISGNWKFNPGSFKGDFHGNMGPTGFIQAFWLSSFMLLWRSGLLIFWLALSCAMAAIFQPSILRAQAELRQTPARSAALGFLWTILFWVLLVVFIFLSLMMIGIPLVIVLVAFNIALSAFGMTLVFSVVGEWLARRMNHPSVSIYAAVFVGACFIGLLRLVPIFGSVVWFIAGLFGIGATLASRFGASSAPSTPVPTAPLPITA